ncbi:hypothetical protein [Streptomyces humi]
MTPPDPPQAPDDPPDNPSVRPSGTSRDGLPPSRPGRAGRPLGPIVEGCDTAHRAWLEPLREAYPESELTMSVLSRHLLMAKSVGNRDPNPLAAAGLPEASTGDRYRAHGVMVTDFGETASVEWFPSRSLRRVAAEEQLRGWPMGDAERAHEAARRHLHAALFGLLTEAGYLVEATEAGVPSALIVRVGRVSTPVTLIADIRRILADLPHERDAAEGTDPSP